MYLDIQRARMGDRLTTRVSADPETLDVHVPILLLQPLVENAVRHGAAAQGGPSSIELRARGEDDFVVIEVEDDGPGPPDSVVRGYGLENTRMRLAATYGPRADVDVLQRGASPRFVEGEAPVAFGAAGVRPAAQDEPEAVRRPLPGRRAEKVRGGQQRRSGQQGERSDASPSGKKVRDAWETSHGGKTVDPGWTILSEPKMTISMLLTKSAANRQSIFLPIASTSIRGFVP